VIDTATQQVVDTLPSGPDPELFTQDAAGKILYVANENDNTVTIIDLEKRAARRHPGRRRARRHGDQPGRQDPDQYVRDHQHGAFHRHRDAPDRRQRAGRCAAALCRIQARRLRIVGFVGDRRHRLVIDPAKRAVTGKITSTFPACESEAIQPVGIGITKDGKTAFIALGPANRVAVVDATSHQVTKYLLVGQRVWHMAFTPDEKYLLVTNGVSNDVSVIDVAAQKVIKTIQVGELPWGITIAKPCQSDARRRPTRRRDTAPATIPRSAALSIDGVSHSYGARGARWIDVSFTVAPASFTALLGLNGAGKSTLFSLITRLFGIQAGRIGIFGHDIGACARRSAAAARRGVPAAHARSRSLGDAKPALSRRLHGIAGARRGCAAAKC
jgi:YVTN family beta-propeller protein